MVKETRKSRKKVKVFCSLLDKTRKGCISKVQQGPILVKYWEKENGSCKHKRSGKECVKEMINGEGDKEKPEK